MQNIISIMYILWNSKGLGLSFFSWNLRHISFVKNIHTIYNKLLLRLYASMNCVTSQFMITPFSAHSDVHMPHLEAIHNTQTNITHLQQKRVLMVFLFSEHTRCLYFPLDGHCCERFTSSGLSWAPDELGLPRETPLTTFHACYRHIRASKGHMQ
jgi:hypothetical protein